MEAERTMKLERLKAEIRRASYEVDADAVADAIVARLLTGSDVPDLQPVPEPPPEPEQVAVRSFLGGEVLEAG